MSPLGVSTYAYAWRRNADSTAPMSLGDVLRDAARLDVGVVQVCDAQELDGPEAGAMARDLAALGRELGIVLEVGTRGVEPDHLLRYLALARDADATFCRSMLSSARATPDLAEAVHQLREVMPEFERAGVTLGLETYEQFATVDLVRVIEAVGSPRLGVVLDPGNCVARLEHPAQVVSMAAPYTVNLHVKDFAFSRKEGTIGFTLAGVPLGTGLLDFPAMWDELGRHGRDVSVVVEHWLTRQRDLRTTQDMEAAWVEDSLTYLREHTKC